MGTTKKKIGREKGCVPWNKGKPWSNAMKKKISLSKVGIPQPVGEKSKGWKGSKAKYHSVHNWIRRNWGSPEECEECGEKRDHKIKKNNVEWACLSGKLTREKNNWKKLCRSCHCKNDNLVKNLKRKKKS